MTKDEAQKRADEWLARLLANPDTPYGPAIDSLEDAFRRAKARGRPVGWVLSVYTDACVYPNGQVEVETVSDQGYIVSSGRYAPSKPQTDQEAADQLRDMIEQDPTQRIPGFSKSAWDLVQEARQLGHLWWAREVRGAVDLSVSTTGEFKVYVGGAPAIGQLPSHAVSQFSANPAPVEPEPSLPPCPQCGRPNPVVDEKGVRCWWCGHAALSIEQFREGP